MKVNDWTNCCNCKAIRHVYIDTREQDQHNQGLCAPPLIFLNHLAYVWQGLYARFTKVPLKALSNQVWMRYPRFVPFNLFIFIYTFLVSGKGNEETHRRKRDDITFMIRLRLRVLLWMGHCHRCLEVTGVSTVYVF